MQDLVSHLRKKVRWRLIKTWCWPLTLYMHRHVYTCEHICTSYTYTLHEEWTEGHHTLHNVTTSQSVTQVFFSITLKRCSSFISVAVIKNTSKKATYELMGERSLFRLTVPCYSPSLSGSQGRNCTSHHIQSKTGRETDAHLLGCWLACAQLNFSTLKRVHDPLTREWHCLR